MATRLPPSPSPSAPTPPPCAAGSSASTVMASRGRDPPPGSPSEPVSGTPSERTRMGSPRWSAPPPAPLAMLGRDNQGQPDAVLTPAPTGLPIETRLDGVPSAPAPLRDHRAGPRAPVPS